jgi:hypothetical protein
LIAVPIQEYEFLKKEILSVEGTIYAKKMKNRIIAKYDLNLDYDEERSLSCRLGRVLQELYDQGYLSHFGRSPSGNLKYVKPHLFYPSKV